MRSGAKMLTKRQTEVWKLISEGHQTKKVAYLLGISEHTVKIHIHHLYIKLNVENRTQAAVRYFSRAHGLASLDGVAWKEET